MFNLVCTFIHLCAYVWVFIKVWMQVHVRAEATELHLRSCFLVVMLVSSGRVSRCLGLLIRPGGLACARLGSIWLHTRSAGIKDLHCHACISLTFWRGCCWGLNSGPCAGVTSVLPPSHLSSSLSTLNFFLSVYALVVSLQDGLTRAFPLLAF